MRKIKQTKFAMIAGLLGAALLMGSPLTSEADPGGKWWAGGGKGKGQGRGRGQVERRQESRGGPQQSDGGAAGSFAADRQQARGPPSRRSRQRPGTLAFARGRAARIRVTTRVR